MYEADSNILVYETLSEHLKRTRSKRCSDNNLIILVSYIKLLEAVVSTTICRWTRIGIQKFGINAD